MANDVWRCDLSRYAQRMSHGEWVAYKWLQYVADLVTLAVLKGGARIIIEAPPRHGKSELISRWLPAWFLDLFPDKRVMLASYGADLAEEHSAAVRDMLRDSDLALATIRGDAGAAADWKTEQGGGMRASGILGGMTGHGADLFILDDLIKNWQEARSAARRRLVYEEINSSVMTRREPGASVIHITTRWHPRDPAGALMKDQPGVWTRIRLPALAETEDLIGRSPGEALCPERYPRSELLITKEGSIPRVWGGLYQQRPTISSDGPINPAHIRYWYVGQEPPAREVVSDDGAIVTLCEQKELDQLVPPGEDFDGVITSWDMTFKKKSDSDFVAGHAWGWYGPNALMVDRRHDRMGFRDALVQMLDLRERWKDAEAHLVEDSANGPAIVETIQDAMACVELVSTRGESKEARLESTSPMWSSGHVWLPHPEMKGYEWAEEVETEIVDFPSEHDDDADAASQALNYIRGRLRVSHTPLMV